MTAMNALERGVSKGLPAVRGRGGAFCGLCVAFLLALAGPASCTTWTVTKATDDGTEGTLRYAVSRCDLGDTVVFGVGTVVLTQGAIRISGERDVTIKGPATIIQAASFSPVFIVSNLATCVMNDLTIERGGHVRGGGVHNDGAIVIMTYCTIRNNQAAQGGGGLANIGGNMELNNCTITKNVNLYGSGGGGGVFNSDGTLKMTNCSVFENTADESDGGGVYSSVLPGKTGSATLKDCYIYDNTCKIGVGGGLCNNGGKMTLKGCKVYENRLNVYRSSGAGGIACQGGTVQLMYGCSVTYNLPENITGDYWADGTCTIGSTPRQSAVFLSGYEGNAEPEPRDTTGEEDVNGVVSDLADPASALSDALAAALSRDLGRKPSGAVASLYYANTFENVSIESQDLVVEYTASWPGSVRYYSLFCRADGGGYEIPERGVQFEIKAGQSLPDGVTPPDFYVAGEGLMTWRNVVTDNGSYDMNPAVGIVTFRVCSVRAAESAQKTGVGCDAGGVGVAPLALLLGLPLLCLGREERVRRRVLSKGATPH